MRVLGTSGIPGSTSVVVGGESCKDVLALYLNDEEPNYLDLFAVAVESQVDVFAGLSQKFDHILELYRFGKGRIMEDVDVLQPCIAESGCDFGV